MKPLGEVEVTVSYRRHTGPRYMAGGVTLRFELADQYSFHSTAVWPSGTDYSTAIGQAVATELERQLGVLPNARIVLTQVEWDKIDSSEIAIRRAAAAAVKSALDV